MSTIITVDLDALAANYRHCLERLRPAACAAVVKADAYGLGIRSIAPALHRAGCRQFFTATHSEGVVLRSVLPDAEIFVFEGATRRSARVLEDYDLIPVLIAPEQSAAWAERARARGEPLPAILDIDTGMTRLGFGARDLRELLTRAEDLEWLDLRYVMTHFACADDPEDGMLRRQLKRFDELRSLLPPAPVSLGNSAGALLGPESSGDMARLGIALFGGNPFLGRTTELQAVLRVQSRILQIRHIDEDTPVGYGATYTARPGARIATVGTGYADGYPWSLGNRGVVAINGRRIPVIGRVSMDLITIDVTGLPENEIQPGQLVDLIGPDISLEELAERAGTLNYEILTRLSQRARRRFVGAAVPC